MRDIGSHQGTATKVKYNTVLKWPLQRGVADGSHTNKYNGPSFCPREET